MQKLQAPAIHGDLSLAQRAELGLTGFLLFDLFALVSAERERKHGVAKGTYTMAPQTRSVLQSVALSSAVISTTKEPTFNPWTRDQGLSECYIEKLFGQYRAQSQSGDLSAKSFWCAAAVVARRQLTNKNLKGPLKPKEIVQEQPLGEEESLRYA